MIGLVKGVGRFWWDFVIGDDWKIAAAVATVLVAGGLLVAAGVGSDSALLAPLVGLAIAAGFTLVLVIDVLPRRR